MVDTSYLLECAEEGRSYLSMADDVVPVPMEKATVPQVVEELSSMTRSESEKRSRIARVALELAEALELVDGEGEIADEAILSLAAGGGYVVATTDGDLRRELRDEGVPVIGIRRSTPFLSGRV